MPYSVIHIGGNKTGSTTLQRCVFPRAEGLMYLGEDCAGYANHSNLLNSLVSDDDIHFPREEAQRLFLDYRRRTGTRTFLYSNEDIMTSRVPTQCAMRLKEFVPGAEILVVIRNQLTAIPSMYANHGAFLRHVPRHYWRRHVSFDEWMDHSTTFIKYSYLDSYFYHRILTLYAKLFGRERIHVLLYEDLQSNLKKFIEDLCRILRVDAAQGLSLMEGRRERRRNTMREFRYLRFRSWFLHGRSLSRALPGGRFLGQAWSRFLAQGPPADGFMSDGWRDRIAELYRQDNSNLAREYELPLRELGYPLEAASR